MFWFEKQGICDGGLFWGCYKIPKKSLIAGRCVTELLLAMETAKTN
jgi:hypothetical protein